MPHRPRNSSSRTPRLRAIAFDEYPLWLDTLERLIAAEGVEVVGRSTIARETIAMLAAERPHLFVCGIDRTAGPDGLVDSLLEAASRVGGISTIVVSNDADPRSIQHCLASGASAYALKTIRAEDLAATIRQTIDRCVYLLRLPIVDARRPGGEVGRSTLTSRELEVLLLVADGLTNAQAARRLWISVATVKFHLSRAYRKIGVVNRTGVARWAEQHGLLGTEERPGQEDGPGS